MCLPFERCNTKEMGVRTPRRKMGSHRSNPLCNVWRYRKLKIGILPYRSNSLCIVRTMDKNLYLSVRTLKWRTKQSSNACKKILENALSVRTLVDKAFLAFERQEENWTGILILLELELCSLYILPYDFMNGTLLFRVFTTS